MAISKPRVKTTEDGSQLVQLSDGTTVKLSPMKGKHLEAIENHINSGDGNITVAMKMIAMLSGMAYEDVQELPATDVTMLTEAMQFFRVFSNNLPG